MVPFEGTLGAGGLIGATALANFISGGLKTQFFFSPLIFVEKIRARTDARNRDLNPIGVKRNLRQHFGMNSRKIQLSGFISPIAEYQDTEIFGRKTATATTQIKYQVLKHGQLNQNRFLIIWNNDFDVVTIDAMEYEEDEEFPYVYHIKMAMTSLRIYDGFKYYLESLGQDVVINTLIQNILPTITFS